MDGPGQAESAKQQIGGGGHLRMLGPAHAHNPPSAALCCARLTGPPRSAEPSQPVQFSEPGTGGNSRECRVF